MNPTTKKDLAEAKAGLYDCRVLRQEIEKAKACGIPCEDHENRTEHLYQFFTNLLEQYSQPVQPLQST